MTTYGHPNGTYNLTITITNGEWSGLQDLAHSNNTTVKAIIEGFIADLTQGVRSAGSDERLLPHQWLERRSGALTSNSALDAAKVQRLVTTDGRPVYVTKHGETVEIGATTLTTVAEQVEQGQALLTLDNKPHQQLAISLGELDKLQRFIATGIADEPVQARQILSEASGDKPNMNDGDRQAAQELDALLDSEMPDRATHPDLLEMVVQVDDHTGRAMAILAHRRGEVWIWREKEQWVIEGPGTAVLRVNFGELQSTLLRLLNKPDVDEHDPKV